MATEPLTMDNVSIGHVAGSVWHYLAANGPVTISRLVKDSEVSRDLVMQAVGWLAREGKVQFVDTPRSRLISLTEDPG